MNEQNSSGKLDLTYYEIYGKLQELIDNEGIQKLDIKTYYSIKKVLAYSLVLLYRLEHSFYETYEIYKNIIYSNIDQLTSLNEDLEFNQNNVKNLIKDLQKKDKSERNLTSLYLFNILINHITYVANKNINFDILRNYKFHKRAGEQTQVFLSYAHLDKLYTFGLYYLFEYNNIYLYVDWMHNGKITDKAKLKYQINDVLKKSKQFLFLRTFNSELGILGSGQIRQWCSWEIGSYYCKNNLEKYYTKIYDEFSSKANEILETFKPLSNLHLRKMI